MTRARIVAILTGALSIAIALAYLGLVLLLDTRGEMQPAPITETVPTGSLGHAASVTRPG